MDVPVVATQDLTKRYGRQFAALSDMTLEVRKGKGPGTPKSEWGGQGRRSSACLIGMLYPDLRPRHGGWLRPVAARAGVADVSSPSCPEKSASLAT